MLTLDLSLTHFEPKLEIIIQVDVIDNEIGAVILLKFKEGKTSDSSCVKKSNSRGKGLQLNSIGTGNIFAVTKLDKFIHCRIFLKQTKHCPRVTIDGSLKGIPTFTANHLPK